MKLTCYVVDDEYHAVERLKGYIAKTAELELIGSSTNPLRALEEISTSSPPKIIFLDIDMAELSGLELAGLVNNFTTVVFTTAYREYALEAFEKQAIDYLLKPISYGRFLQSIQKISKHVAFQPAGAPLKKTFFFVKGGVGNKFTRIDIAAIRCIIGADNYIEIYVKEQMIVTYMSMGDILKLLPETDFSRIHKSFIINHAMIEKFDYGHVTLVSKEILPIGRVYRKTFHQRMKIFFDGSNQNDVS